MLHFFEHFDQPRQCSISHSLPLNKFLILNSVSLIATSETISHALNFFDLFPLRSTALCPVHWIKLNYANNKYKIRAEKHSKANWHVECLYQTNATSKTAAMVSGKECYGSWAAWKDEAGDVYGTDITYTPTPVSRLYLLGTISDHQQHTSAKRD